MTTYTAKLGQFQVPARPDLGTIEGVQLLQDGQPVALLWSTLDRRFYGEEKARELRATLATVKRILGRHDNYADIVDAWRGRSREYNIVAELPMAAPTAEAVAVEFCGQLADALSGRQLADVVDRNNKETDPGICHSHDFCDANELMAAAFENLGVQTSDDVELWDDAWDIAKAAEFDAKKIGKAK